MTLPVRLIASQAIEVLSPTPVNANQMSTLQVYIEKVFLKAINTSLVKLYRVEHTLKNNSMQIFT